MVKLGILSDTHGYIDSRILHHLSECDLIWHAGDIGNLSIMEELKKIKPTQGVYGNIDDATMRNYCPEFIFEKIEGLKFLMIHIAGSAQYYNTKTRDLIAKHKPDVLICGHSHILKVMRDQRFNLLHINPGAAGTHGFHKVRTLIKFEINSGVLENLKVIELGPRSTKAVN